MVGSPSTVPEIEHQVSHELDIAVLDVDCRAQPTDVFGDIVAKHDASHRRLAPLLPISSTLRCFCRLIEFIAIALTDSREELRESCEEAGCAQVA